MNEWIFQSLISGPAGLLTADVVMYKWLLGGGIVLMAVLGLVFFGMLALMVLRQEETPAKAASSEDAPAATEHVPEQPIDETVDAAQAPQEDESSAEVTDAGAADGQEE